MSYRRIETVNRILSPFHFGYGAVRYKAAPFYVVLHLYKKTARIVAIVFIEMDNLMVHGQKWRKNHERGIKLS